MKFPVYRQLDMTDCGPACLRMIASYYGREYGLSFLRERCHITKTGVSMLGISDAAESIGMRSKGVKLTWHQLSEEAPLPCIVHWKKEHFVVVIGFKKRRGATRVEIVDPGGGRLVCEAEDFKKGWIQGEDGKYGLVLLLGPTSGFYEKADEGKHGKKYGFRTVFLYLRPYRQYVMQILLAMLVSSLVSLLLPFITQSIVDVGIGAGNLHFIVMLLFAQLALTLGQFANDLIRSWLMLHTTSRVSISLISDFLRKLMKLPIAFFDSKKFGDIMQRLGDYGRIQSFLTGSLLSMVIAAVSFVIYAGIMVRYSGILFLIFIIGAILYVGWVLLFMKQRRKLDQLRFVSSSANQSNIVQLIDGMQDIKLNNCERQKRWEWENIQANLFKINVKSLSLGQAQDIGSTFIDQAKNILISFVAAKSVVNGDMSIGMMMAVQYVMGQINAPISQFISFVQDAQDAKISLERLGEIHGMDDEEPEGRNCIKSIPCGMDIVLDDVSFQYDGPRSPKVLDGISLTIPFGKVTAIVGTSGSGKTTLLKLLLGFYAPVDGRILIGGNLLGDYSKVEWRNACGCVMQEGFIFSETVASNIAMSEENPDMDKVENAAAISNIDEWIANQPLGYDTIIGPDGHGLSMGQKQRILIARAAYKDPRYLFLDEATNSLDANNEKTIMENLGRFFRGKTVVIVAHRLSTVRDADNIVVLDGGRIAEMGTHSVLSAKRGKYFNLVKNQLELGV